MTATKIPKTIILKFRNTYDNKNGQPITCLVCNKKIENTNYTAIEVEGKTLSAHTNCFDLNIMLKKSSKMERAKKDGLLRKVPDERMRLQEKD